MSVVSSWVWKETSVNLELGKLNPVELKSVKLNPVKLKSVKLELKLKLSILQRMPTVGLKRELLFSALGQTFTEEQFDAIAKMIERIAGLAALPAPPTTVLALPEPAPVVAALTTNVPDDAPVVEAVTL